MAGIEPASERLERQTSTSVSDFYSYSRAVTCIRYRQPAVWTLKPSFTRTTAFRAALQHCVACSATGWRTEQADVAYERPLHPRSNCLRS